MKLQSRTMGATRTAEERVRRGRVEVSVALLVSEEGAQLILECGRAAPLPDIAAAAAAAAADADAGIRAAGVRGGRE